MRVGGGNEEVEKVSLMDNSFKSSDYGEKDNIWREENEGLRRIFFFSFNQKRDSKEYFEFEGRGAVEKKGEGR